MEQSTAMALDVAGSSIAASASKLLGAEDAAQQQTQRHQIRRAVHVVVMLHPLADIANTRVWVDIVRRVESLYAARDAATWVAQVRYGFSAEAEDDANEGGILSTAIKDTRPSISPFVRASEAVEEYNLASSKNSTHYFTDVLCDVTNASIPRRVASSWQEEVASEDGVGVRGKRKRLARLVDGLVAAGELFAAHATLRAPIARYLVHIVPGSAVFDLRETTRSLWNIDVAHDKWHWREAATELGKSCVWPIIATTGTSDALSSEAEDVQKSIAASLPAVYSTVNDAATSLGLEYDAVQVQRIKLLGLNESAANAAAAASDSLPTFVSRKRARRNTKSAAASTNASSTTAQHATIQPSSTPANAVASVPFPQGLDAEKNKQAVQNAMFLKRLQQVMMRNLVALKGKQAQEAPNDEAKSQAIEKAKERLQAHYEALRRDLQMFTTSGKVPDLVASLDALIAIDKDASSQGLNLGGPSHSPALMNRQRQQQEKSGKPVEAPKQAEKADAAQHRSVNTLSTAPAATATATATAAEQSAAASPAAKRPTSASTFWSGAIVWTIALPNSKRSPAATLVAAQCAPNTNRESLMLPWPQKFQVSEVQTVSLSSLQQYASSNGTPCILFHPQPLQNAGNQDTQRQQQNESMYTMLARMIDSKKGCAHLKLQGPHVPSEAGIVVIPTAPPGGGTSRRLLGLVFDKAVPWNLFAPSQGTQGSTSSSTAPSTNTAPATANSSLQQGANATSQSTLFASNDANASLSSAQLNQQLPSWARPQAAAAALASQPVNIGAQTSIQQQGAASASNATDTFLHNGEASQSAWPLQGAGDSSRGAAGAMPANIDFDALSKLLGLNPS